MSDFTLVTTSYNDSANIVKYIEQVEKQTVKPLELIIVDGGSKDDTIRKIQIKAEEVPDFKIRVISDRGRLNIAQGFNTGIKESSTELMVIGGIGNEYDKFFFEELLQCQASNGYDVIYGPIFGIDATNFAHSFNIAFVAGEEGKDFGASNHGVLIKKEVFNKCGFFLENFIYAGEDTEFFRRINTYNVKTEYCKGAKLYWETPVTWREFIKKLKVNSIADLQEKPKSNLLKYVFVRMAVLIFFVASFFYSIELALLLLFCSIIIGFILIFIKHKSLNLVAAILRIVLLTAPIYFYLNSLSVFTNKRIVD
jgi:GT2 family glycosyltransferase